MSSVPRAKRRRVTEEVTVDEETPKPTKRQRILHIRPDDPSEVMLQCRKILDETMLIRSPDGRIVCDSLFKAPSKRLNPEYYQVVTHPIDIARIQQKLASEEYGTANEFFGDFALLIDNQKKYYEEGDTEYEDATLIWQIFQQQRAKTFGGPVEASSSRSPAASTRSSATRQSQNRESVERWMFEALLVSLVELTDSDGRLLSPPFRLLPKIPEYYAKIKQPIDMKTIAQKIRDGTYSTWDDIEKDVVLICKNAKKFNEVGSEIHKDADALLRHFNTRKGELMRLKRGFSKPTLEHHVAVIDELLESEAGPSPELSEDSEEDDDTENSDDPLWILYWTVRNEKSPGSTEEVLCEPFLELPNRSYYPDYYDEIEKPISVFMINKRLKAREYTLDSLVKDMDTMFENAKSYNSDGSNIFKAAVKLQKTVMEKAQEFDAGRKTTPVKKTLTKRKPTESPSTAPASVNGSASKSPAKRMQFDQLVSRYRERLMTVWNAMRNHTEKGRVISENFIYLPCDKTYPNYYEVIKNPIDLSMIKQRIEENKYSSSNKMYLDIKLMCDNARTYNEQDSAIYTDANTLESVAVAALKAISTSTIFSPLNRTPRSKTGEGPFSKARKAQKETSEPKRRRMGETVAVNGVISIQRPVNYRNPEEEKMWKLFSTINEFKSSSGHLLATAFAKMPSRMEYPEYFNVIKKPTDLQRIYAKLSGGCYTDLRALIADFRLLFENACKFNEPDSTIYKEAFYMQRVLTVTAADMIQSSAAGTPSVQMEVRMILTDLLVAVCTHTDIDGKCFSDALVDIHDVFEQKNMKSSEFPFSLDELKTHIQKGRYRRLDRFQEDLFNLFAKTREVTAPSSRIFKATVEMQLFFIQKRDELCRNRIDSPAIFYNDTHLKREISTMQREKNVKVEEEQEEGEESTSGKAAVDAREEQKTERDLSSKVEVDVVAVGETEYRADDYCYVAPADGSTTQPHIMRIQKLYKDDDAKDGGFLIYGFWCYRPRETYHLVTRRFYPNEVFLTPFTDTVVSNRLQGRCLVMHVDDYLKKKPVGFGEKDVFACEQRYLGRQLHFKRLRTWPHAKDFKDKIELVDREEPLKPEKVPSDFAKAENVEPATEEAKSNDSDSSHEHKFPSFFDIEREEVERKAEASTSEGQPRTFYEQMCHRDRWYRLGDCVLVFNPKKPFCDIFRIGCLWRTTGENGVEEAFFSGVWFARPREIKHEKSQTFYRREVIAVDQPDEIRKMDDIQAKCAVLPTSFYTKCRPTEIPECDVFVVEHRVAGKEPANGKCSLFSKPTLEKVSSHIVSSSAKSEDSQQCNGGGSTASSSTASLQEDTFPLDMRSARPLKRLRNCTSTRTVDDEVLYLKTALVMEKQMSPLIVKTEAELPIENRDLDKEASAMKNPPVTPGTSTGSGETTPSKDLAAWLAVQPKLNSKSKSGYILFSAEIRKRIMNENPEAGFGEVSKIVGIEWKKLNDEEKKQYEVRAQYISDERAKLAASTPSQKALQPGQVRVFMCRWQLCDWQFDCEEGLYDHMKTAHTSQIVDGENQYVCLWASCIKYRKEGKPFPSLPRLHRHIKEKHLPTSARPIYPNQRNKNYYVYQPPNVTNATPSAAAQMSGKFINHPYGMPPAAVPATTQASTVVTGQPIVVNGHPQTIPPGHAVVQAGGVPPRMINAQMSVKQVLRVMPSTSAAQVAPTIVYSTAAPGQPITAGGGVQYVQPVQQQYSSDPSTSQQVQQIHQPVYVVQEQPQRRPEPVFVPAPNSVHVKRVLHSEIYLRYIESMSHGKRQRHVSKWDRNLSTNPRNSAPTRALPYHWLKGANLQGERPREEDVVRGLWRLRDDMLTSTLNIERQIEPSKW